MASTFLTRLRLGGKLVDAKARQPAATAAASPRRRCCCSCSPPLVAVGVVLSLSTDGRAWVAMVAGWWDDAFAWVRSLFT